MLGRSCLLERLSWTQAEDVFVAYAGTFTWDFVYDTDTEAGVHSSLCIRHADPLFLLEDALGSGRGTHRQAWWFRYLIDESNNSIIAEIRVSILQQRH